MNTADLMQMPARLRALADQIERLGPLLNPEALKTPWKSLVTSVARLGSLEPADVLAPMEDYLACRHPWLTAWASAPDAMTDACKKMLGPKAKVMKPQTGEDAAERQLRLLCLCLAAVGSGAVLEAVARPGSQAPTKQVKPTRFIEDPEARDALHRWGAVTEDEFLAQAKHADPDLIKRGAALLGFKLSAKPTPTALKKVHRAAVQFHRNTRT